MSEDSENQSVPEWHPLASGFMDEPASQQAATEIRPFTAMQTNDCPYCSLVIKRDAIERKLQAIRKCAEETK